ncbi:transposable element Tcb2 transposase [Trichonephila clavipes]|nr:transposable element Tcb2 transposase [Trichonephila clavipes]
MKKNVVQWVQDYKEGRINEARRWCYQYYNWNYASLQSHLLDDLTEEERQSVIDNTFENSDRMRNSHFCVFRMSPDHREDLLKRFSLLVLGIYLLWLNQIFFLDAVNKADAARRLNVSRSVVQRLWDQYQSEDSVSRRSVPGRPRATTPAEDCFLALSARRRTTTVPQLVADHFQASGRRISATTVRNRLHNAGLYARRPVVCVPLNGRQRRNRLCWAREHVSWTQQQWASVLFTDESIFTMESDSGRLLIWREHRTRYHQSNTVERHSYRGGGILVWAGISLGGHTDLHVFHGGTVTGLRYRDEILDPYISPYAAAIGNDFIQMDDNARPHRARIVEEYLEDHGLERMEWPAQSSDLNPIEHLWDYLGREVAALNPPPRSLHELKQGLLCVWSSLPIPVSDNLINSIGNRCRQCIQVRGGHIPY